MPMRALGGGARGALAASLILLGIAVSGLAFLGGRELLAEGYQAVTVELVMLAVLTALGLGALWIAYTLLDSHFDDLERLRGDLVVAAGSATPFEEMRRNSADAGPEVQRLSTAIGRLSLAQRLASDQSDERLAAVVGAAAEGLIVITETGLVSLVNAAATQLVDAQKIAVGTSVYAGFDRNSIVAAWEEARRAGRPIRWLIRSHGGKEVEACVADLGDHGGLLLSFPAVTAPSHEPALDHDLALHDAPPPALPAHPDTPLEELSAVVLDSETTGLDVQHDRIVSVGALRLQGRRVYPHLNLDWLVNPDRPIPARSTAVHGITDQMVANAPQLPELMPRLEELLGKGAMIGHNIGFDLTILEHECARCGLTWQAPPSLDTGLLVAVLEPTMVDLDLERIAERFGVAVHGRHTALGDALVTAEVFVRLIPRLQDRGVQTLGAAQALAAGATRLKARQRSAGWRY